MPMDERDRERLLENLHWAEPVVILAGALLAVMLHLTIDLTWARGLAMVGGLAIGLVLGVMPPEGQDLSLVLLVLILVGIFFGRYGLVASAAGCLVGIYLGIGVRQRFLWKLYWEGRLDFKPRWQPFKSTRRI